MAKNGLNVRYLCPTRPRPTTGRILGYVAQNQIPKAPIPAPTPHTWGFPSLRIAQRDAQTSYQWSLGAAGGQPSPQTVGAKGASTSVPGAKKTIFSKVVRKPLGMLRHMVLARFEAVVTRFGSWKMPKCLANGSQNAQRGQRVKGGSKTLFSTSDPGAFGMLRQVFVAHFGPVFTKFSPFHHMSAPGRPLRTYLRAVWWSYLKLGRGLYIYTCISTNLHPSHVS